MNKEQKQKLAETFLVPGLAGVAAIGGSYLIGESGYYPMFGMSVPGPLAVGGVVFGSSLLGNVLGNYALPYLPANSKNSTMEKLLLLPVLTGGSCAGLIYLTHPLGASIGLGKPFALGAGSEIAAQYSVNIVKPYIV